MYNFQLGRTEDLGKIFKLSTPTFMQISPEAQPVRSQAGRELSGVFLVFSPDGYSEKRRLFAFQISVLRANLYGIDTVLFEVDEIAPSKNMWQSAVRWRPRRSAPKRCGGACEMP